jgi:hypothetical protein
MFIPLATARGSVTPSSVSRTYDPFSLLDPSAKALGYFHGVRYRGRSATYVFCPNNKSPPKLDGLSCFCAMKRAYFGGGGYFLKSFSMALLRFLLTFAGSLPEPRVLLAAPRQIWFLAATS